MEDFEVETFDSTIDWDKVDENEIGTLVTGRGQTEKEAATEPVLYGDRSRVKHPICTWLRFEIDMLMLLMQRIFALHLRIILLEVNSDTVTVRQGSVASMVRPGVGDSFILRSIAESNMSYFYVNIFFIWARQ
jgi:hypothetical protein